VGSPPTPEHLAGSDTLNRSPGEWTHPFAEAPPVESAPRTTPAVKDVATAAEQPATTSGQAPADRLAEAAAVERVTVILLTPAAPASANVQLALPLPPDQSPGRQSPDQAPAVATAVAQASFALSPLVTGAQGPPAAPRTLSPDASPDDGPNAQVLPLPPGEGNPPGGAAERPAPGPLAAPALAGLVTPAAAWVEPGPFRSLRQFFPQAREAGRSLAASLAQFLRLPWVGGAAALAALEVLRRRARRRAAAAAELPEITGPRGL
jgi:hypothetical protein